tara:strand:- start:446 stop:655 length:210 start_codon:yes stop_codon:yes gene_type:complete
MKANPYIKIHEADLIAMASEFMLCKSKAARLQRNMLIRMEEIDDLVTRLDLAYERMNEHREACKKASDE